jgi:hypothetical protein
MACLPEVVAYTAKDYRAVAVTMPAQGSLQPSQRYTMNVNLL